MKEHLPKAVVMSVLGGVEGSINVVRSLGREGVPVIVVSEDRDSPVMKSKYAGEALYLERFTLTDERTRDFLINLAKGQGSKPVLFPTADPDLLLISRLRKELQRYYHLIIPGEEIVDTFTDKRKFYNLSKQYNFPIPKSFIPADTKEVSDIGEHVQYPVIMKPSQPSSWTNDGVKGIIGLKKAVIVKSSAELIDLYTKIAEFSSDIIIQEYIPGEDDCHYDLHLYMDKNAEPLGAFTGRKIRIHPAYAGSGCFVRSMLIEDLIKLGIKILKQVDYTGLANFNFKKDPVTADFKLLEINPRVSQWSILAAACGVNLPLLAYYDSLDLEFVKPGTQEEEIQYLSFIEDLKSFIEYRRNGDWTFLDWVYSLLSGKKVYQFYASDDLRPFFLDLAHRCKSLLKRLF